MQLASFSVPHCPPFIYFYQTSVSNQSGLCIWIQYCSRDTILIKKRLNIKDFQEDCRKLVVTIQNMGKMARKL